MDIIFTSSAIAIVTTVIVLTLSGTRPELALMVSVAGGIIILMQVLPKIQEIIDIIKNIACIAGIDFQYINIIFKATGMALIITICSGICKDAGQSGIATKLEIAGRIAIVIISLPVIGGLFNVILSIME